MPLSDEQINEVYIRWKDGEIGFWEAAHEIERLATEELRKENERLKKDLETMTWSNGVNCAGIRSWKEACEQLKAEQASAVEAERERCIAKIERWIANLESISATQHSTAIYAFKITIERLFPKEASNG